MLFEGTPERPWRENEKRISRMVFIGRELEREVFEEVGLNSVFVCLCVAGWCVLGDEYY